MNHKKTTILAAVLLLTLFCAVVIVHDYHARKKAHARIASHAGIVANALWSYNQQGAAQYLSLASPVGYDDKVIGTTQSEWNYDTLYFVSIFLVVLVLVFVIFQLYRGLVREKKLLENRVAHRTSQLSDLNKHLEQEIKKHKQSKQALEKSEERYRAYFEENIAGAYISSPAGQLITCNREYLRIFGFKDKRQALDTAITDIYAAGADREKFLDILGKEKKVSGHETTFRRIDGTLIHLIENAAAVFDENGNLDHIRGFLLDVTEKKHLESQLIQTQKMESIGRLAGGVAHDFNNMLNVILGHTELALDKVDLSDPMHNNLQQIHKAAGHSAEITKKLLGFARKQTISPKTLNLNETVEGMFNMLRRLIGEDIDLLWQPAGKLWPVKIDPSQVDQILANLCVNAKDAIADRGRIIIETSMKTVDTSYCALHPGFVPGDFVLLAVSDNGCGMDQETLANLFEPFFTTKGVGKGTGLGLSTVYGIVRQNNGCINVYTEQGTGTTFHIYLPRHGDDTAHKPKESSAPMPTGNGEIILIVEDEEAILELLQTMLLQLGYAVLAESSPCKALERARTHDGRIHLLITDVVMPEMNGRELAGQMTALYPDISVLFMSGYTANVIAHQGMLEKGVQFIQKPFSMQDIALKVNQSLSEK